MSPRPSIIPSDVEQILPPPPEEKPPAPAPQAPKPEPGKPPSRAGACRVCLKAFKPDDFSRTCAECTQRVCEDCASYRLVNTLTTANINVDVIKSGPITALGL